ncbi:MAG: PEP-CTERM sorting domain-containing protein [Kiritimatiellales bacterium]|jgi:hypothetical protein
MKSLMAMFAVLAIACTPVMAQQDIVWGNNTDVVDWLGNGVTDANSWIVRLYESTNSTINFANLVPTGDDTWTGIEFNWGGVGVDGFAYVVTPGGDTTYGLLQNDKTYSVIFNSSSFATATRWAVIDDSTTIVNYGPTGFDYDAGGTVAGDWQVVPEPATFLLFGMGGMGAWMVRRRNRLTV